MLLAGSNDKDILTVDIKELMESEPYNFDASSMGMSERKYEEDKSEYKMDQSDADSAYRFQDDPYEEEEKVGEESRNKLDDTDFLNKQEIEDDDQLRTILQEQERIMQKDQELRDNKSNA